MERTQPDPRDEALRRLIDEPSYAARVLTTTARLLEMDPTVPMTNVAGGLAMNIAADTVLQSLPDVVRRDNLDRAADAVPDLAGVTRGEAALRLRAAAKALG